MGYIHAFFSNCRIKLRSTFTLIAFIACGNTFAVCIQLEGMRIPDLQSSVGDLKSVKSMVNEQQVEQLKNVYRRIAVVSGIRPALILC